MIRGILHFIGTFVLAVALVVLVVASAPARALSLSLPHHGSHPLLVGYFSSSSLWAPVPFYVKNLVTSDSAARLDQINYASAAVHEGHCSLSDPEADLNEFFDPPNSVNGKADDLTSKFRGNFHQLQELKRRYPRLKILISLEGRASDFAIDAQPENRVAFVRSCVDMYLRGRFAPGVVKPGIFDGIDIDWESPHQEDAPNFRALIEEFRRQMNTVRPGLRLSLAVDQSPTALPGTDFAALAPLVDQFGIMNYDYAGPWSKTTGLLAPLFPSAHALEPNLNIEASIAAYKAAGIPARKLLMGLPFYAYGWTGVGDLDHGLYQAGHALRGDHPYHAVRAFAVPAQVYRDPHSQAPWIFDGQNFWTYEDATSIRYKASYAIHQQLGGVMIWELSDDTADAELLSSAYQALRHPLHESVFDQGEPAESSAPTSSAAAF